MSTTPKIPVVSKSIIIPFILVTSLFALWGFANAVTDPMVQAFKKVLELSNSQAAWVQMAFYGGYFCMALPAAMFMRKYSYKVGILIGLGLYAGGALLFYPAAITEQFWFFSFFRNSSKSLYISYGCKRNSNSAIKFSSSF